MTKEDEELMEQHGITLEQKSVYCYRGHKYDKLEDALRYARLEASQRQSYEPESKRS